MGAIHPEHAADDAGPEAVKGPPPPEPVAVPGENTDEVDARAIAEETDPVAKAALRRERAAHSFPGQYPTDDPDLTGEDRFDAG
jgi:hypothetical protein